VKSQQTQNKDPVESRNQVRAKVERLLRRRKFFVTAIVAALLLVLLLLNVLNWLFLAQMKQLLDEELGKRLTSIALLAAQMVENEYLESFEPLAENQVALLLIQDQLRTLMYRHQLEGAFLIDRHYRTLVDGYAGLLTMDRRTYLFSDSLYIVKAWQGIPTPSPLHTVAGTHFKSAYAPIHNPKGEIIAVIVTEANADFFAVLSGFKKSAVVIVFASIGIFVVFSLFLYRALILLMKTQESLRQSERLGVMGQMAAVMAHEIRNPLGIIRSTADVLKSKYLPPEEKDELFDYIPSEVNRLNNLISDFLSFTQDRELNLENNDLNQITHLVVCKVKLSTSDKRIQIHEIYEEQLPTFPFDANAMEQVILNLLQNAVQAISDRGEIFVHTSYIKRRHSAFAQVEIRDTGTGIQGDPQQVFEPFYTTKSTGSGLGMAISKRLIEKHGGQIEIESQISIGTTVRFRLPIR